MEYLSLFTDTDAIVKCYFTGPFTNRLLGVKIA